MLSIAFKNGIIMSLIILIVHFLIKNYLIGKFSPEPSNQYHRTTIESVPKSFNIIKTPERTPLPLNEIFVEMDESVAPMQSIGPKQAPVVPSLIPDDEDLYKYIKSLENSSNIQFNANTKASTTTGFCDVETTDNSIKKAKPIDPSTNGTPYFMLNAYDDENIMNGGHIFKNIDGFEETMMYSDYEKLT
jgi:hypothetical protein